MWKGEKSLDNSMSQVEVVDIKILPENHKKTFYLLFYVFHRKTEPESLVKWMFFYLQVTMMMIIIKIC